MTAPAITVELSMKVYEALGLSVGTIVEGMSPAERRAAYACDVVYATNNELGFDYLRDNMAQKREDKVQRGHNYCIVDEVDSILIDEARTPLIISGPAEESTDKYYKADRAVREEQPRRAVRFYEKSIRLNPRDHIAWNNMGVALARMGEVREAIDAYTQVVEQALLEL